MNNHEHRSGLCYIPHQDSQHETEWMDFLEGNIPERLMMWDVRAAAISVV
jgi:hypothetical protein